MVHRMLVHFKHRNHLLIHEIVDRCFGVNHSQWITTTLSLPPPPHCLFHGDGNGDEFYEHDTNHLPLKKDIRSSLATVCATSSYLMVLRFSVLAT